MREFLVCLVTMCAVGGVATAITPETGIKKYVSFAVALAFCCALFSYLPFSEDRGELKLPQVTVEDRSEELKQRIIRETVKKICESVKADVMKKYSVNEDEITVSLDHTVGDEVELKGFYIELYGGRNMMKLTGIQYYVTERYGTECTVVYIEQ